MKFSLKGGSREPRGGYRLADEPRKITARSGHDGEILWERGSFSLPGSIRGKMLIAGRGGRAVSLLTGEWWMREQQLTGKSSNWRYSRRYGCNTLNASNHLLLFRSGYAGFFDLEHDTGTGTLGGFRSGCTPNMIVADGVLNALDYTRTCNCSYAHQTSLAMIHMPQDSNIESWTRYDGAYPDPERHGLNFGAPGRRVDIGGNDPMWYDREGTHRRHPSAIKDNGGGLDWVAASVRETDGYIEIEDLIEASYIVRLHFAELDETVEAGQRVFDLEINGEVLLSDFDVVKVTGAPLRGAVEEFVVNAAGNMEIKLRRSDGSGFDPVISGIKLVAERNN